MTTFKEALAQHGSAKEAISRILHSIWSRHPKVFYDTMVPFGDVARWVLDNAPAIHQHQSGKQADNLEARVKALETQGGLRKRVQTLEWKEASSEARVEELAARIQALEDAPGPRPNEAEVSALRQRMDGLTELLEKLASLDTSDVLTALVRDVALLKDDRIIRSHPAAKMDHISALMKMFGTEPQTPEARKMLGLDVATPEAEPVYEWIDDKYHFDGKVIGGIYQIYNGEWFAVCQPSQYDWRNHFEMTPAHARAWVEAQFSNPKNQ